LANKNSLVANTDDVIQLDVAVVDKHGVVVSDASPEIKVDITGPARLIGIDNGSQLDTTAFKSNRRKAFGGKLLITIQATALQGPVKMELQSPGLKHGAYTVKAISPSGR
jgi:beta-galactosidase